MAILFPESIGLISVIAVYFHQAVPAFILLVGGMLIIALTFIVVNSCQLWHYVDVDKVSSKAHSNEGSIV